MKARLVLFCVAILLAVSLLGGTGWWVHRLLNRPDPFLAAQAALAAGDTRNAVLQFRTLARNRPDDPALALALAECALRLDDPDAALKELNGDRARQLDQGRASLLLARALLMQGRFAEVLESLPAGGADEATRLQGLVLRAAAQVGARMADPAAATLADLQRTAPNSAEAALVASRLALTHGSYAEAERQADAALARAPSLLDALLIKEQLQLARRDTDGAVETVSRAIEAAPWSAAARTERARLLMRQGKDEAARKDLAAVLAQEPQHAAASYLGAVLVVRSGKYADAARELQRVAPLEPAFPRIAYYEAFVAEAQGEHNRAVAPAQRYARAVPGQRDGQLLLARIYLSLQQPDQALQVLGQDLAGAEPYRLRGDAYALLGHFDQAADSYEQAAVAAPDDDGIADRLDSLRAQGARHPVVAGEPGPMQAAAALRAGDAEAAQAALDRWHPAEDRRKERALLAATIRLAFFDLSGAADAYADGLRQAPQDPQLALGLARVRTAQGQTGAAVEALRPALAAAPGDLGLLTTAVRLLVRQDRLPDAKAMLEAARAMPGANPAVDAMLSQALIRGGEASRAVAMLAPAFPNRAPPVLWTALAQAQLAAKEEAAAVQTLILAQRAFPDRADLVLDAAALLQARDDLAGARTLLERGLVRMPAERRLMQALVAIVRQQDGTESAFAIAEAFRARPASQDAALLLPGEALVAAKDFGRAAEWFAAEYRARPNEDALTHLVSTLVLAGRTDQASDILHARLRTRGNDLAALRMLADIDLDTGRIDAAQASLEAIVAVRTGEVLALNNLAWIYGEKEDPRAVQLARRAFLLSPSPVTADTLGWILVHVGQPEAGRQFLQQAHAERPDSPSTAYHLAKALAETNARGQARILLTSLLAGQANFNERGAAQVLLSGLAE